MGVGLRPRLARLVPVHHRCSRWGGPGVIVEVGDVALDWECGRCWSPVVVEVVAVAGSAALLVGRRNSLMSEFQSPHFLHGLGAVAGRRCEPLRCAASCELRAAAPRCSGSGTRGMGDPAAVKRF